jgi:hypothetical protein
MPRDSIEDIQRRIKDLEDSLRQLDTIDNDHTFDSVMAWITGVPANIAKPIADAIFNSPLGERVPGLKQGYQLLDKIIEIKLDPDAGSKQLPDKLINLSEITAILEKDEDGEKLISLTKATRMIQQGDRSGALKELASNFVPDAVDDGINIADGIESARENHKDVSSQWNSVKTQIQQQRDDLIRRIETEKNKLYNITGGQLGSLSSQAKDANVFTRINELLAQINASIQQLNTNLQV